MSVSCPQCTILLLENEAERALLLRKLHDAREGASAENAALRAQLAAALSPVLTDDERHAQSVAARDAYACTGLDNRALVEGPALAVLRARAKRLGGAP